MKADQVVWKSFPVALDCGWDVGCPQRLAGDTTREDQAVSVDFRLACLLFLVSLTLFVPATSSALSPGGIAIVPEPTAILLEMAVAPSSVMSACMQSHSQRSGRRG